MLHEPRHNPLIYAQVRTAGRLSDLLIMHKRELSGHPASKAGEEAQPSVEEEDEGGAAAVPPPLVLPWRPLFNLMVSLFGNPAPRLEGVYQTLRGLPGLKHKVHPNKAAADGGRRKIKEGLGYSANRVCIWGVARQDGCSDRTRWHHLHVMCLTHVVLPSAGMALAQARLSELYKLVSRCRR